MMKRTFRHAALLSGLLVFSSLILTGCFDMNYPDKETYYELFSDSVTVIKTEELGLTSTSTTKSLETDFFNDDSVNDVSKATVIDADYYEYLCIKPSDEVIVDDFALYVKSDDKIKMEVRLFVTNEEPDTDDIRSFGLPNDEDGEPIPYSDRYFDPIASSVFFSKADDWQSIYIDKWFVGGKDSGFVTLGTSDYLVIQFLNNTGYGIDAGYEPLKFTPVNLMVSPKNEKYQSGEM